MHSTCASVARTAALFASDVHGTSAARGEVTGGARCGCARLLATSVAATHGGEPHGVPAALIARGPVLLKDLHDRAAHVKYTRGKYESLQNISKKTRHPCGRIDHAFTREVVSVPCRAEKRRASRLLTLADRYRVMQAQVCRRAAVGPRRCVASFHPVAHVGRVAALPAHHTRALHTATHTLVYSCSSIAPL